MYSITGHGSMIDDEVRTDAYVRALRLAIKPGSVVLDIGTGTGFFALIACRLGARRVYAVESDDIINVARKIAAANRCEETIEFIQGISTDITLPEQADVIVSDLHGILPFYQNHIPAIADARRRFLAPGGVLVPRRDTVWLACVEAPELHRPITTPWSDNKLGFDMRPAQELQANQWRRAVFGPGQVITTAENCCSVDYTTGVNPNMASRVTVRATRAGTAHGLCAWFDANLADGVELSNSPERSGAIYGNAFFPWPVPVRLDEGDTVAVDLQAKLINGEYLWTWETRFQKAGGSSEGAIHFRQSDFFAEPLSLGRLRRQAADHVPELNEDGRVDALILSLMGEGYPLGGIARQVAAAFPRRFARWQDALTRTGELSNRYSR